MMLLAGIGGGMINYLLPSNSDATGVKIRKRAACIALGIGATILVPLFLEIAQSKLMDNIHYSWTLQNQDCNCDNEKKDTIIVNVVMPDTTQALNDTAKKGTIPTKGKTALTSNKTLNTNCCVPLKNYFLYFAYCFLAAAAGIRFINAIMDGVLKDKQISDLKVKNEKTEAEKEQERLAKEAAEKQKNKLAAQDKKDAEQSEREVLQAMNIRTMRTDEKTMIGISGIGPVVNSEDRQKGRFGGKQVNNDRKISATVSNQPRGSFYDFTITVESTDPVNHPLIGQVILFLHDSFSPSVVTLDAINSKAEYRNTAYGAFTVGAIADNGKTLLEIDLAELSDAPAQFLAR